MNIKGINCFYSTKAISFNGKKIKEKKYSDRMKYLEEHEILPVYAQRIANFSNKIYRKSIPLIEKGLSPISIEPISKLGKREYRQAGELIDNGIVDDNIIPIAKLGKDDYSLALDYWKKGIDAEAIFYLTKLPKEEKEKAISLMQQGITPKRAACFAQLSEEQIEQLKDFEEYELEAETLKVIAEADDEQKKECKQFLDMGINGDFAIDLTYLGKRAKKKLPKLISMDIGDENLYDFACLEGADYKRATTLLKKGVISTYIKGIVDIENGRRKNEDYQKYREHGYSYSSSFALSTLDQEEDEHLEKILDKNPQIKDLLKEEYDITVIENQLTREPEALLSREYRKKDGTKVTIVDVFDDDGNEQKSILEEYPDKSSKSVLLGGTKIYKTQYDKFGEIKDTWQISTDIKTGLAECAIHSKASDLLKGCFDTVYYPITKELTGKDAFAFDIIPYLGEGETISKAYKNSDGSISFEETVEMNDCKTERYYTEKKDDKGETEYQLYSYKISTEDGNTLLDINRSMETHKDGSKTNIINGIRYRITYDDEHKTVTVNDGKKTKTIQMKDKLPYYNPEIIWQNIKKQPVDALIMLDNINQWRYCDDMNSAADELTRSISTGTNQNIINHEYGHLKDYEGKYYSLDDEFIKIYDNEMRTFYGNFPYNEQEFIQYLSTRADLTDSEGTSEFFAEANIILNSYGTNHSTLNTRPQFLVRYFPRSIAKAAELSGKNSTTSLLDL